LTAGQEAGVVIGSTVGAAVVVAAGVLFWRSKRLAAPVDPAVNGEAGYQALA